jgi:hypothetical protein
MHRPAAPLPSEHRPPGHGDDVAGNPVDGDLAADGTAR